MDYNSLKQFVEVQGIRILSAILVLIVGLFAVKWILNFCEKRISFQKIEPTFKGFLHSAFELVLYSVVVLTVISILGIPLTSVIALVASAGVAFSLAMQGALSNFVGGVTMLMMKQFRVGDYIKIGSTEGTVQSMGLFYTEMLTPDNCHISMPNSSLTNTSIVNYTREGTRRMDVNFSVSYTADTDQVCDILMNVVHKNVHVLANPSPTAFLSAMQDSSLTFTIRLWCRAQDYWTIYFDMLTNGKRALDNAGIEIPYPQMDVHIRDFSKE